MGECVEGGGPGLVVDVDVKDCRCDARRKALELEGGAESERVKEGAGGGEADTVVLYARQRESTRRRTRQANASTRRERGCGARSGGAVVMLLVGECHCAGGGWRLESSLRRFVMAAG